MTRYSNPLPHTQVPNSQGRPAGTAQPAQAPHYEPTGWPAPNGGAPRTGRPAAPTYGDPAGYAEPQTNGRAAHHDPYAALRPDGYGYGQQAQPAADPYGLAGYTAPQPQPQPGYGHASQTLSTPQQPAYGTAANNASYGGNGSAYGAANPAPPPYGGAQSYGYGSPQAPEPSFGGDYGYSNSGTGQWGADHYAEPQLEPALGPLGGYQNGPLSQHGTFDQSYAEDEAQYEDEPRRGGGWKKVVGLVACTILVGGGLAIAYGSIMGPGDGKDTPLIKGASGPSKVKPSEPGGKQFAHADSKIMGRLGEGDSGGDEGREASGVRKVPVVTVGRDGSIQPPSAQEQTSAVVAVPGLTVIDGFGSGPSPTRPTGPQAGSPPVQMVASADANPVVVAPPKKPAQAEVEETGAVQTKAAVTPKADPPPKKQKVAAATPPETGPKPTGAGYVAVLASVPASGSSRIDALKQFADMQQKYTAILQNKTPDVQEANLGEKGTYHRLLVGPPGSRDSASSVCTQLKAQGYTGCWVTAY
jgi:cell division septation protein DedD